MRKKCGVHDDFLKDYNCKPFSQQPSIILFKTNGCVSLLLLTDPWICKIDHWRSILQGTKCVLCIVKHTWMSFQMLYNETTFPHHLMHLITQYFMFVGHPWVILWRYWKMKTSFPFCSFPTHSSFRFYPRHSKSLFGLSVCGNKSLRIWPPHIGLAACCIWAGEQQVDKVMWSSCIGRLCINILYVFFFFFQIGGIVLDIKSSGSALSHWYDMLKTPNQLHIQWHTLEKLANHEQEWCITWCRIVQQKHQQKLT